MTLTASELAGMRWEVAASLPDTVQIRKNTVTRDHGRSNGDNWSTIATVSGAVYPQGSRTREYDAGDRLVAASLWTVTLPHGTTISTDHRVVCNGYTYEIVSVDPGMSDQTCVVCDAQRVA